MSSERIKSFEEFWPFYLNEHKDPVNRALHFVGTAGVLSLAAMSPLNPMLLAFMPVVGYGCAWFGHFIIEKNRPATFTYPLWSLLGDFKMFGLFVTGRLGPHLERAGVRATA